MTWKFKLLLYFCSISYIFLGIAACGLLVGLSSTAKAKISGAVPIGIAYAVLSAVAVLAAAWMIWRRKSLATSVGMRFVK